jgi:hypothetical protein
MQLNSNSNKVKCANATFKSAHTPIIRDCARHNLLTNALKSDATSFVRPVVIQRTFWSILTAFAEPVLRSECKDWKQLESHKLRVGNGS